MAKHGKTAITPTREEDYPEWYQQVVKHADLAENSPVRGCMVIKPWGYALWENIVEALDSRFKAEGVENAYFPLFIPLSYLEKEAQHVEGFAKECAVVTHHRLAQGKDGKLEPASPLEEPLIVRPTSETIFGEMYAKWIQSYRDLPMKMNQWANIVRWEMRTRMFLRTVEILWQEGHCAFATKDEAYTDAKRMLDVYTDFMHNELAVPVIQGEKTESERFPGAVSTLTMEVMTQDLKALQAGTSHFLGQNFAKAAEIKFRSEADTQEYAWTTSWGVTNRLIGAMIMVHSDDDGLVLPPRLAPVQVVIVPVIHKDEDRARVLGYCEQLKAELSVRVRIDSRDMRAGEKAWYWVKKGVPIRVEIGPREIDEDVLSIAHRTKGPKDYIKQSKAEFIHSVQGQLDEIQATLFKRAKAFQKENIVKIDSKDEFYEFFKGKGGFAYAHWNGDAKVEEQVQQDLGVTIRCIPFEGEKEPGSCVITGEPSPCRVIFAKAY
ncbi:MAG: proline--tRNA ligase [Chlamydiales bacterium]|nr:proline--tRNA ligase [Chlamydiales bacterium]